MSRDAAQGLLLPGAADHDRQVRLDGRRGEAQAVGPVPRARVRDLLTVQQRAHDLERLLQPVEAVAEAPSELDAVRRVLALVPSPAEAQDRPAAADVVDGRDRLGDEARVPEGDGAHEQAEPDATGHRRPGSEARVPLEHGPVGVPDGGEQVVPGPQVVVAELVDPPGGRQVRGPVGVLGPQLDTESGWSTYREPRGGVTAWSGPEPTGTRCHLRDRLGGVPRRPGAWPPPTQGATRDEPARHPRHWSGSAAGVRPSASSPSRAARRPGSTSSSSRCSTRCPWTWPRSPVAERPWLGARCSLGLSKDTDISSTDAEAVARGERLLGDALSVTRDIGSPYLGRRHLQRPGQVHGHAHGARAENAIGVLRRLAEQAAAAGITLGLEIVNRYETNLINTAEQALRFIDGDRRSQRGRPSRHLPHEHRGDRLPDAGAGLWRAARVRAHR